MQVEFTGCLGCSRLIARPGRASLYPGGEVGNLFVRQFAARRHLQVAPITNRVDKQAFFRMTRSEDWPGVTSLEKALPAGEGEPAAQLLTGAVAFEAMGGQHGPDLFLEKLHVGGIGREYRCRD